MVAAVLWVLLFCLVRWPCWAVCDAILCVEVAQLWFDLVLLDLVLCTRLFCCYSFLGAASSSDAAEARRCGLFSLIYAGARILLPMKWRTRCLWWCYLAGLNGILCYIIWFANPAGGELLICSSAVLLEVEFSAAEGYCA
ncbi:hypothetical protein Nepgr_016396 [Nepenthes gracilis]|uniref:Uncharacterized protein n=1 Tax=Nepenthes gracilis TaxID=150966 RepID=A0AAD3SML0_NEPGR|nr:hypothetical protein Nepgr_016396 [Nepenthes gracilis]